MTDPTTPPVPLGSPLTPRRGCTGKGVGVRVIRRLGGFLRGTLLDLAGSPFLMFRRIWRCPLEEVTTREPPPLWCTNEESANGPQCSSTTKSNLTPLFAPQPLSSDSNVNSRPCRSPQLYYQQITTRQITLNKQNRINNHLPYQQLIRLLPHDGILPAHASPG